MRPEHERRSSARTARSGAVEFGSGPPLAGSRLDVRVGSGGGGGGVRAARREGRAARGPRGDGGCGSWTCIIGCFSGLCARGSSWRRRRLFFPGGLKNPPRGAPPLLWPDPVLAVGSFGRGWTRWLVQRTTVPWRHAGAGREPT